MIAEYARALPFGLGERAYQELQLARFLGKLAVGQGVEQLRQRLQQPDGANDGGADADRGAVSTADRGDGVTDTLPIAEYDELPAARIVPLLAELDSDGLAAIDAHERSTRQRRTVLTKIAQLRDR